MGRFRTLSRADVEGILSEFGITNYAHHEPIEAGTINTNFKVVTGEGPRFLRVNEGKSLEDVQREAAIVAHVAARGLPTPAPALALTGEPFVVWGDAIVSLFPWVEGSTLTRREVTPAHAHQVGQALGRLHLASESFHDHRPGRYEPEEIERRLARLWTIVDDDAVGDALAVLAPELRTLAEERGQVLPSGIIHGDLFIDNVLFTKDGRLSALLDFEQAAWGRFAYDVAVTLLAFAFGRDDFRTDVVDALLVGYARVRPFVPLEREAFAAELRFAACRFAVTRITDVHLRRTEGAPRGKDFRRYLLRLKRVQEHVASGSEWLVLPR